MPPFSHFAKNASDYLTTLLFTHLIVPAEKKKKRSESHRLGLNEAHLTLILSCLNSQNYYILPSQYICMCLFFLFLLYSNMPSLFSFFFFLLVSVLEFEFISVFPFSTLSPTFPPRVPSTMVLLVNIRRNTRGRGKVILPYLSYHHLSLCLVYQKLLFCTCNRNYSLKILNPWVCMHLLCTLWFYH